MIRQRRLDTLQLNFNTVVLAMNFLAIKFSSSSLFHDVEVCLSRMDLVSTALAADEDVQLSDAARSAMIDIIAG